MSIPKSLASLVCIAFLTAALPGCGPRVSEEELGTVVTDPARLPGAGKPYPLPKAVKRPATEENAAPVPRSEPGN